MDFRSRTDRAPWNAHRERAAPSESLRVQDTCHGLQRRHVTRQNEVCAPRRRHEIDADRLESDGMLLAVVRCRFANCM